VISFDHSAAGAVVAFTYTQGLLIQVAVGVIPLALFTYAFINARHRNPRPIDPARIRALQQDPNPSKTAALLLVVALVFGGIAVLLSWGSVVLFRSHTYMRDHGIPTEAVITAKPITSYVRTGTVFYVQYQFPVAQGDHTMQVTSRNAVYPADYSNLQVGQSVPIKYDPVRPTFSVLNFERPKTNLQIFMDEFVVQGIGVAALAVFAVIVLLASIDSYRRSKYR
jgi:hypothetical protein